MAEQAGEGYVGTILLAGPPGAGKTTLARELSARLPGPLIHIEGDKFWSFYAKDKPGQGTKKRFGLMMRSITASTTPFVRAGYNVLVDFAFPPHFLETLKAQRRKTDTTERLHYIILRPSLEVCQLRAAQRDEDRIENYDRFLSFYHLFEAFPENSLCDDQADPLDLADRILKGIEDGRFIVS